VLLGRSDRGGARPRDVGGEGDEQQGEAQAHGEPAPEEARERRCLHCLVQEACKGFGWRCVPSEKNTRKEHEMGGRKDGPIENACIRTTRGQATASILDLRL
jgi:hypothetical protein